MKIKLIIFDWDDVFTLGSKEGYIKCLHGTLEDLNIKLDPKEEKRRILSTWGKPHKEELKGLSKEHPELLNKALEIYEKKFFGGTYIDSLSLVKGSNEFLEQLKEKYVLTIATGAHPKILKEQVMPKFQIPNVFSQIISSYEIDDPEKQKPHPYALEEIMKTQGFQPNETVFVGDAKTDVQMARDAGVTPIVVLTGHLSRQEAEGLGVDYVIEDVTHLDKILIPLGSYD